MDETEEEGKVFFSLSLDQSVALHHIRVSLTGENFSPSLPHPDAGNKDIVVNNISTSYRKSKNAYTQHYSACKEKIKVEL